MLLLLTLIEALERDGVLRSVSRAVDPRYELIAVMRAVQKAGNEPLLFSNVTGSPVPVVTNVLGRRDVLALALGLRPETLLASLVAQEAAQADPVICPMRRFIRSCEPATWTSRASFRRSCTRSATPARISRPASVSPGTR